MGTPCCHQALGHLIRPACHPPRILLLQIQNWISERFHFHGTFSSQPNVAQTTIPQSPPVTRMDMTRHEPALVCPLSYRPGVSDCPSFMFWSLSDPARGTRPAILAPHSKLPRRSLSVPHSFLRLADNVYSSLSVSTTDHADHFHLLFSFSTAETCGHSSAPMADSLARGHSPE